MVQVYVINLEVGADIRRAIGRTVGQILRHGSASLFATGEMQDPSSITVALAGGTRKFPVLGTSVDKMLTFVLVASHWTCL